MQTLSTQEKISKLISKIQIDWKRATGENHGISRIDKDILSDDIKKIYDLIYELDISSARQTVAHVDDENIIEEEKVAEPVEIPVNPVIEAEEHVLTPKEEINTVPEQAPLEFEITNVGPEENEPVFEEKELSEELPRQFTDNNSNPDTKASLDLFSASKTLADVYQNDEDNSLAAKIKQNKIADIKAAIGINDKFLFINEIFKGEMSTYNQTIEALNGTNDFHEAIHYIDQLKLSYGSEENKPSFNKLFEIAKRKFH